jgi:hypothetical protein
VVPKDNVSLAVALVCFTEEEGREEHPKFVEHLYGALMLVSCAFLVATLVIYALIPELRDLQGKCLMANIMSLALGFLPLAFIQFYGSTISQGLCVTKGILSSIAGRIQSEAINLFHAIKLSSFRSINFILIELMDQLNKQWMFSTLFNIITCHQITRKGGISSLIIKIIYHEGIIRLYL